MEKDQVENYTRGRILDILADKENAEEFIIVDDEQAIYVREKTREFLYVSINADTAMMDRETGEITEVEKPIYSLQSFDDVIFGVTQEKEPDLKARDEIVHLYVKKYDGSGKFVLAVTFTLDIERLDALIEFLKGRVRVGQIKSINALEVELDKS